MSGELVPVDSGEVVKEISQERIAAVQQKLHEAVLAGEEAMKMIREEVGPNPGKIPQDILTQINQGLGYLRHPRDTIDRMFREWTKVVRQMNCLHDRGLVHKPKRSYCKICDWEFVHRGNFGWVPLERTGH